MTALMEPPDRAKGKTLTPERRKEALEWFSTLLTTADLLRLFDVTIVSIHGWRKDKGLPAITVKGDRQDFVRFDLDEVVKWAKKNDRKYDLKALESRRNK